MLIYGHRGAMGESSENTLASFAHLRQIGVHHVELDIRLADNELIVLHDSTVDRTTSAQGRADDFSLPELQALGIPSLKEVLQAWPELQRIQLEVKTDDLGNTEPKAYYASVANKLAEIIAQFKLEQVAIITSIDPEFLFYTRAKMPHQPHGLVVDPETLAETQQTVTEMIELASTLQCECFLPNHELVTEALVETIHQQGMALCTWTVNSTDRGLQLQSLNIDGLITDFPSRFLEAL